MESKPKNILVALDASNQAFEAVRYVGKVLPAKHTHITLFHVRNVIPESLWDLESGPDLRFRVTNFRNWEIEQNRTIEDFMEKASRLLQSMGYEQESISSVVKEKVTGVARDIANEALKGYDAVVVGRHGISKVKDLIMGTTANRLLNRLGEVPIWVVGGTPDPTKMLLAVDSSEGAGRAVDYVANLFDTTSFPSLLLLNASRGLGFFEQAYEQVLVTEHEREWLDDARRAIQVAEGEMERCLQGYERRLIEKGAAIGRIEAKILRGGSSRAASIMEVAEDGRFGTIVLGRRGLSKVEEFIMGRVSNKVLQIARDRAVWLVH